MKESHQGKINNNNTISSLPNLKYPNLVKVIYHPLPHPETRSNQKAKETISRQACT